MVLISLQGGLGNNLFQTAFLFAYAKKHGLDYRIPLKINNPHYEGQKTHRLPGIIYCNHQPELPIYQEKAFTYEEIPKMDDVCFSGYFQSWKYFDDYRDEIIKAFGFKYERKKNYCSVHIRLGDYLNLLDKHPPITKGYLFEAMMNIMTRVQDWEAVKFLVFSDSMNMAKEILSSKEFNSFPIEYSEGKNEVEDLESASSCNYNIGSNSAWSWWAHYLNQSPDKIGTFPAVWFGSEMPHDTKDLIPPKALRL